MCIAREWSLLEGEAEGRGVVYPSIPLLGRRWAVVEMMEVVAWFPTAPRPIPLHDRFHIGRINRLLRSSQLGCETRE